MVLSFLLIFERPEKNQKDPVDGEKVCLDQENGRAEKFRWKNRTTKMKKSLSAENLKSDTILLSVDD